MIAILGIPTEAPARLVIEAAGRLGLPYVIFNQRESSLVSMAYALSSTGDLIGELRLPGAAFALDSFTGIYVRLMDFTLLPEHQVPENRPKLAQLFQSLNNWLEITPARVMNRASAMACNQSKLFQAQLIAAAGFQIPETLVTNDPISAREFISLHQRVIYKSCSAVRSIVRELSVNSPRRALEQEIEKIRSLPVQFQAYIPGDNLRVHVAGEEVFGTLIRTPAVDYRYAGREGFDVEMEPIELGAELALRCRELAAALELPLCGIDLKRTPNGQIYCFEANPMPAFSYYESMTGQPIAEAAARWLAGS